MSKPDSSIKDLKKELKKVTDNSELDFCSGCSNLLFVIEMLLDFLENKEKKEND